MKNYCAINGKPVRWHVISCHALCFRGRDANGCSNWKVLSSRNLQTCNVMGDRTRFIHGLTSYHLFKPFYTMDTVIMICIQQQHFLSVTLKSMPRFFFLIMYYRHLEAWIIVNCITLTMELRTHESCYWVPNIGNFDFLTLFFDGFTKNSLM